MAKLRPWLFFGGVLFASVGVWAFGFWLTRDATHRLNREELRIGIFIVFPGALILSGLLAVLVNFIFPSERLRLQEDRKRKRPQAISYRIKKLEKLIKRMRFLKRHPSAVFLFCIVALAVSTAMFLAPVTAHDQQNAAFLHVFGPILGAAYIVALFFLVYAVLTKKWEGYVDASIQKLEARLATAQAAQSDSSRG